MDYQKIKKNNKILCVNCQLEFDQESDYLAHYHSEIHRYNVKRKLVGLQPLSMNEYSLSIFLKNLEFQEDRSSKNSVTEEFYCEICSKKFLSSGTYKQHLGSKKHHLKREELKCSGKIISKSSSLEGFDVTVAEKSVQCLFCQVQSSHSHLQKEHNFPPFEEQCIDVEGLLNLVKEKIENCICLYCNHKFTSVEGVRQHMKDVSHCKLDLNNFEEFEKFYLWKIDEENDEEEGEATNKENERGANEKQKLTWRELEQRRLDRIQLTNTGAIINGKEVGFRYLRNYYKQYLSREVVNLRVKYQPAIEGKSVEEEPKCLMTNYH